MTIELLSWQTLRWTSTFAGLVLFLAWEHRRAARPAPPKLWKHDLHNLLLGFGNGLVPLAFGLFLWDVSRYVEREGVGLFQQWNLPPLWAALISIPLLDVLSYTLHVLYHKLPVMWKLHRMHHSDKHLDVTSALRFHPLEILLSTCIQALWIRAWGIPLAGLVCFQVLFLLQAQFQHANLYLPRRIERLLCRVFVTPNMHRVHHSIRQRETDSNFATTFSFWDRLGGTFRPPPQRPLRRLGLEDPLSATRQDTLWGMLSEPFLRNSIAKPSRRASRYTRRRTQDA